MLSCGRGTMGGRSTRRPSCGVDGVERWVCCVNRKFVGSVQDFGNEGTILDEGVVIERS